jgi:hypothetical protein
MKTALPQVPAVFNARSGAIQRQAVAMPATAVLVRTAPTPMPAVFLPLPLVVQKGQASQSIVQLRQAHRSAVAVATAAMPPPGRRLFGPDSPMSFRPRSIFDSHYRGLKASDSKDLIAKLVREFGEANRQRIVADIAEISRSRATWSLMQIRLHFRKLAEQGTRESKEYVSDDEADGKESKSQKSLPVERERQAGHRENARRCCTLAVAEAERALPRCPPARRLAANAREHSLRLP